MSNPLFEKLGGMPAPQMNNAPGTYNDILARAQQMAKILPPNFNPQSIVQSMLQSSQITQEQLNQAMQIANSLTGRRPF